MLGGWLQGTPFLCPVPIGRMHEAGISTKTAFCLNQELPARCRRIAGILQGHLLTLRALVLSAAVMLWLEDFLGALSAVDSRLCALEQPPPLPRKLAGALSDRLMALTCCTWTLSAIIG